MVSWHTVSLFAADTNCETHVGPPTGKTSPTNVLYKLMSLLKGLDDWRVIEGESLALIEARMEFLCQREMQGTVGVSVSSYV